MVQIIQVVFFSLITLNEISFEIIVFDSTFIGSNNIIKIFDKSNNNKLLKKRAIYIFKIKQIFLFEVIKIHFTKENIGKNIKENIKNKLNKLLDEPDRKVNHLNILVLGISGVGKSCLIKIILGLGKNSKETPEDGFFNPQTEGKPKYYNSKLFPFLKLADTQGIEISSKTSKKPYGISEVEKDVTEFIVEQNESGNPDNYVHCIWYCFQSNSGRFQDDEEILLEKLSKEYSIETLPSIMVGTQANSKEKIELFKDGFAKKI